MKALEKGGRGSAQAPFAASTWREWIPWGVVSVWVHSPRHHACTEHDMTHRTTLMHRSILGISGFGSHSGLSFGIVAAKKGTPVQ